MPFQRQINELEDQLEYKCLPNIANSIMQIHLASSAYRNPLPQSQKRHT